MIPTLDLPESLYTLNGVWGSLLLDPSFRLTQSQGAIRQSSFRNYGQEFITYFQDQMKQTEHGPLILEGIVNHQTAQEHLTYIIDLWQKVKTCTSILLPNAVTLLTDSDFYIRGFATREAVDNSNKISKIRIYLCIIDTENL